MAAAGSVSDDVPAVQRGSVMGNLTPEHAAETARAAVELLQAVSDEIAPGAVAWRVTRLEWIDDGNDEIVIRVVGPEAGT